jgi:hypothetical protein
MRKPKAKSKQVKPGRASAAAARKPSHRPPPHDPRLKKIYVAAEGTFVLHNASEIHKIVIATAAFDVSGWLDLSNMAPGGDSVQTEVRVSFANRVNVLHMRYEWSSPQLIALGNMTNGLNYLSGTHIEIWVHQTASHNNFATPVEYAYQFVVESAA